MKARKPVTPKNMEKLAVDLMDYFYEHELWDGVIIYVNGNRYFSSGWGEDVAKLEKRSTDRGTPYWVERDVDVNRYIEYNNPKTVTISFEGALYDMINYVDYDFTYKLGQKFLEEYGMYFEQGHAWNMAAYEI